MITGVSVLGEYDATIVSAWCKDLQCVEGE